MIRFELDARSGLPTYQQLIQQVRHAVRLGLLQPGEQLPTAREVVAQLAINPNTVLKAYRELEHAGLVVARQGQGTFVADGVVSTPLAEQGALRNRLARWVRDAREAGLEDEDLEALFREAVRAVAGEEVA